MVIKIVKDVVRSGIVVKFDLMNVFDCCIVYFKLIEWCDVEIYFEGEGEECVIIIRLKK